MFGQTKTNIKNQYLKTFEDSNIPSSISMRYTTSINEVYISKFKKKYIYVTIHTI